MDQKAFSVGEYLFSGICLCKNPANALKVRREQKYPSSFFEPFNRRGSTVCAQLKSDVQFLTTKSAEQLP
jgi:hypothetical protein